MGAKTSIWVVSDWTIIKLMNKYPDRTLPVLCAIPFRFMGKPYYDTRRAEVEGQLTPEQRQRVTFISRETGALGLSRVARQALGGGFAFPGPPLPAPPAPAPPVASGGPGTCTAPSAPVDAAPLPHARPRPMPPPLPPMHFRRCAAQALVDSGNFGDRWPSSWLLTIMHMLSAEECERVYVHGFVFFKQIDGKIHYMEDTHTANHHAAEEERICLDLIKQGRVRFVA